MDSGRVYVRSLATLYCQNNGIQIVTFLFFVTLVLKQLQEYVSIVSGYIPLVTSFALGSVSVIL